MGQALLTLKEIAALLGITKRAALMRAEKESWPFVEERGNGGKTKKFIPYGLPMDIQLLYNKELQQPCQGEETKISPDGRNDNNDDAADSLPAVSQTNRGLSRGALEQEKEGTSEAPRPTVICPGLTPWQNEIAVARYDLVSDYIKAKDRARKLNAKGNGDGRKSLERTMADFIAAYNTGHTHEHLFKVLGAVAHKTVEKWRGALTSNGLQIDKLAPRYGDHRRGQRIVTEAEMSAMLKFALHPNRMRISQVIRWAKKTLIKDGAHSPSSEATMRRALVDWQEQNYDRWIFCREGEKALTDKVLPYLERDSSVLQVGDLLVADGHKLNFNVINPYTGKPKRAALLMFYDWASRYPAGWYIMMEENTQCIHAALRRAILSLGKIPVMVMLDNGKAFKAKVFTGKVDFEQAGIQGLYSRLGIQTHFTLPYNAQSKPVERFFGTFNELERLLPSYTGNSIEDKPAYLLRNERHHKRLHNPWVPDINQADKIIRAWAYEEYAARAHRGLKGSAPADIWSAGKGPGIDESGLRYLMMAKTINTVHRNGVTIFGVNFYDEALYGYKRRVLVRHDILDMTSVYIYSEDDTEFVCEARPMGKIHPVAKLTGQPLDLEAFKEGKRRQGMLKRGTVSGARASAVEIGPWEFPSAAVQEELPMSPGEIKQIEEDAAAAEIIFLDEKREPEMPVWDADRYEMLLEKQLRGVEITTDDMIMMTAFEKTANFRILEQYFENFRERIMTELTEAQT
jgi:putative transposase